MIGELLKEDLLLEAVKRGEVAGTHPAAVREIDRLEARCCNAETLVAAAMRVLNLAANPGDEFQIAGPWSRERLLGIARDLNLQSCPVPPSLVELTDKMGKLEEA